MGKRGETTMRIGVLAPVLIGALVLSACGGSGATSAPEQASSSASAAPPSASTSASPSVASAAPASAMPSSAATPTSSTGCLRIAYDFARDWEDKGQSYQKVWLMPNFRITNGCDYGVKAVQFTFTIADAFGDELPQGYQIKQTVNLKPGKTWKASRTFGYEHYDFNENFTAIADANMSDLTPTFDNIQVVTADGEKLSLP